MTGRIYDLGYKRYVGTRRSPSTRWLVITRHQIATAWKPLWRLKAAVALAVITTFVFGGIMYVPNRTFRGMSTLAGQMLSFTDGALPISFQWYCRIAFYATLTFGAASIAGDVQSGAFTFYFARSVRPRDYVLGKLAGFAIPVACVLIGAPLALALIRLGVEADVNAALAHVMVLPKMIAVGAIATLAYACIPLAFSALAGNARTALALWAAYYLVFGTIVQIVGYNSDSAIAVLDLPTAIESIAFDMFDIRALWGRREHWGVHSTAAMASIFAQAGAAIAIVWYQVAKAQKAGVGGSG